MSWISVLLVGVALLLYALVRFTLDPFEGADCALQSHIDQKIYGDEKIYVTYLPNAGPFKTGGYHMTTVIGELSEAKAVIEGYSVSGNLPPFHKFVIAIQNGVAKYAVDTAGI